MSSLAFETPERLVPVADQPHIRVSGVGKRFSGNIAVDGVSLDLARGEFVTLLGASGCGKTTLLRIIAGFVAADTGRVHCGGRDVTGQPPAQRRMGLVFQSYALFPTKTVAQNIGFSSHIRSVPRVEAQARVRELAALVELDQLLDRYPHELSGGQQQRVALARALACDPEVLLLDEPMSALDARIRAKLRIDLRRLVSRLGITTLYVTHDQEEAFALSDRVAVMSRGRIEQIGTPAEIYHRPATRFVAEFVGMSNLVTGRATEHGVAVDGGFWPANLPRTIEKGRTVTLLYRPEHLGLVAPARAAVAAGMPGRVEMTTFCGAHVRVQVRLETGEDVVADVPSALHADYRKGQPVCVVPDADNAWILPDGSRP
ncbi:ABC transporter ATP-binding protein [Pseudochelatococcus lubricantis]|uniref:ABC transporter ATP-binding protein n=1 Tax=Pseudochelatococcus lubricantis TaxID=1538102 RepID=UPI0035EF7C33